MDTRPSARSFAERSRARASGTASENGWLWWWNSTPADRFGRDRPTSGGQPAVPAASWAVNSARSRRTNGHASGAGTDTMMSSPSATFGMTGRTARVPNRSRTVTARAATVACPIAVTISSLRGRPSLTASSAAAARNAPTRLPSA